MVVRFPFVESCLVPISGLQSEENTQHDNEKIKKETEPVLFFQMFRKTTNHPIDSSQDGCHGFYRSSEKSGVRTWYSRASIQTAAEWERSILEGLRSSEWFLLVMSPHALQSEWVKDELSWAIDHRPDRIIPVMIEVCDPGQFHIRLRRIQAVDCVSGPATGREEVLRRLLA